MDQSTAPGAGAAADDVFDGKPAHRFDVASLEAYCQRVIPDFGTDLHVRQLQGGASNPTFILTTREGGEARRFVLRKRPPGKLLASAHQVDREFRVMKALAATEVPVPAMRVLCGDESVIGTAFYVMDFLDGRVFRDATLPDLAPAARTSVYDDLNRALAALHSLDFEALGLGDFGRPGNYFERQIGRWIKQYRGAQTEDIPAMERLIDYLPAHIPTDDSVSIAHGDYRLENTMFHPTEPRLLAVLDWELCTIGHPLADIAYNCLMYEFESGSFGCLKGVDYAATGIPSRDEYVAAYLRRAGREEIQNWNFYIGFALFRLASIGQGVYKRVLDGIAASDIPAVNGCPRMAAQAWDLVETAPRVLRAA